MEESRRLWQKGVIRRSVWVNAIGMVKNSSNLVYLSPYGGGIQNVERLKKVIQVLSDVLNAEFGKGFSVDTLENARKFYLNHHDRISETAFQKFVEGKSDTLFRISDEAPLFTLSWSHCLQLMRIKNLEERSLYEIEATKRGFMDTYSNIENVEMQEVVPSHLRS